MMNRAKSISGSSRSEKKQKKFACLQKSNGTILGIVLQSLRDFASSDLSYELGGVLVGRVGKASRRMFVQIQHFIPATKGISRRASFEFTNEAQQEIHEVMESRFKDLRIVGWFHTHPGYGVFLSSADQFIDQHYFKEKYHIAIVIDPTKEEVDVGAFVWNLEKERVRVPLIEL
jgi:proteasome lid subunit RPN8/RPN11